MSGYIGVQPVPQATQRREYFTATSGQTTFNTNGYTPNYIDVYMNGVKLSPADFTASNGSDVVLASGATTGDLVQVVSFTPFNVANQTFIGDVNLSSGAYKIGGNTAINSSRGGALTSLALTGNATFGDNDKAIFGAGSDLQIYHGSSNSYISDQGAGNLILQADSNTSITSADGATISGRFRPATHVSLYYNGSEKLATESGGVNVTGDLSLNDGTPAILLKVSGAEKGYIRSNSDVTEINGASGSALRQNGFMKLQTNATGVDITGVLTSDALNVSAASPNIDVTDTGTSHASQDFLTNSNAVRATIGVERSSGGGLFVGSSPYAAVFGTASAGNTEFATNNNVRMTISSSGSVGIGTGSPTSHLTVESTATNTADVLRLVSHNDSGAGTTGVHIDTYHDKPTTQDNTDVPFMLSMSARDGSGNNHTYGRITQQIDDRTNGAEKGSLRFWSAQSPNLTELVRMGNGAALAIPTTSNNGIYLGDTPGDYSAYGSGVPTIDIRGTASANRRAGAITFREQDSTLRGAIYSTYGGDGYAGLNFHSTTEAIKFAIGDSTSGPADDIITMEGGSYKGRLNVNYVDDVAANGGIGGVYAYNGFIGANEVSASGSDNDPNVKVRVTINTSTSVWRAGYAWVYASSCGTGGEGPVTAWWFYRFRTYNSSIGAIAVMDSGGDTSSFSVTFSDDGDPDADGTSLVIGIRVASLHSTANDETVMGVRLGTREGPPRAAERISG